MLGAAPPPPPPPGGQKGMSCQPLAERLEAPLVGRLEARAGVGGGGGVIAAGKAVDKSMWWPLEWRSWGGGGLTTCSGQTTMSVSLTLKSFP